MTTNIYTPLLYSAMQRDDFCLRPVSAFIVLFKSVAGSDISTRHCRVGGFTMVVSVGGVVIDSIHGRRKNDGGKKNEKKIREGSKASSFSRDL